MNDVKCTASVKKGQVSLEFAVIIGLIITILIPALVFLTYSSYENKLDYASAQSTVVVSRLANEINMIGLSGPGSAMYVDVRIPQYVEYLNITGREVTIRLMTYAGYSDVFRITRYNLVCSGTERVMPGDVRFRIEAINSTHVNVTVV